MTPDERLLTLAIGGAWSAATARIAGFTDEQIRYLVHIGVWRKVRRGIYTYGGAEPGPITRAAAAVIASGLTPDDGGVQADDRIPCAVAAGRTAARVWEIPVIDDDDPAMKRLERNEDDVIRTDGRSTSATLRTRRVDLDPADVTFVDGVPVLTLLRTLPDLAVVLTADALVVALDHVLHTGDVSLVEMEALAAQVTNRPGTRALRRAVQLADGRAESPLETLTRLVLLPVLPGLRPQVEVRDRRGQLIARLDLADEELRLGVESDGGSHRGRAADDRRRDAKTGYTIERCTWFDVRRRSDDLRRRVLATASVLRGRAA